MKKEDIIYGATKLIERISKEKGLVVNNKGVGHGNDNTLWEGILKDESGIPTITASGDGYEITLRPFWSSPEIDVRIPTANGEELVIFNYSDLIKNNETGQYDYTGDFYLHEFRVDGHDNQAELILEIFSMAQEIERYIKERG